MQSIRRYAFHRLQSVRAQDVAPLGSQFQRIRRHPKVFDHTEHFSKNSPIGKSLPFGEFTSTNTNVQIGGMEIDLPRLYQTVQCLGGLKEVIEKKKWSKVSEHMKIPKSAQDRVTKLDDIYCKYLLPYDTLSHGELNG